MKADALVDSGLRGSVIRLASFSLLLFSFSACCLARAVSGPKTFSEPLAGAQSYVVNGRQSGGFALLAHPAKYGTCGIMTFVVNQDGVVYQNDLGDDTETAARAITTFNPDQSWSEIE